MYNELGIIRKALFRYVLSVLAVKKKTLLISLTMSIEEFKIMGKQENAYNFY